jgi:hypothetical protein
VGLNQDKDLQVTAAMKV